MNGILKWGVALVALAVCAGCSLLKVAVATGDPLSKEAMNARVMTRGFYYDLAAEVERAADSIVAASDRPAVRMAAVRWKIRTTRAGISAVMQDIPDVALSDLWILCRRMQTTFEGLPDSLLFGAQSDIARRAADRLDGRVVRLAQNLLSDSRYELMKRFVADYVAANPLSEGDEDANTTLAWLEYLQRNGLEHEYATGSIAEVLADVNDRVSGQTRQFSNTISWSKDLLEMQFQQDSLRSELRAQLDSLDRNFSRMVVVAEHLPEISDAVLSELNAQASQLIRTMNQAVDNAFEGLDHQRSALQGYVTSEREVLVSELRASADDLLQTAIDAVPGLIGKVLLYLVLTLTILIGGPFALGFWLGGVRQRAKKSAEK